MAKLREMSARYRLLAADIACDKLATAQSASVTYEQRQAIMQDLGLALVTPAAEAKADRPINPRQLQLFK